MLKDLFCSRLRVLLLLLFIVEFFRFLLLPSFLRNLTNLRLICLIFLLFSSWLLENKKPVVFSWYKRKFDFAMIFLAISVVINCVSCLYFRKQSIFETLVNWAPILLLYLYYPLSCINLKVKDWEKILFYLFLINLFLHIGLSLINKPYLLFGLDVSDQRYDNDGRLRLFSDGILFLGSIFTLNKCLISKNRRIHYLVLYLLSLLAILLMGFRTAIFAIVLVSLFVLFINKSLTIRSAAVILLASTLLAGIFYKSNTVQKRISEITERNRNANFENDDYVRVLIFNFYYTEYFKSKYEMIFGSGMVRRVYDNNEITKTFNAKYPSDYSRQVSFYSDNYHFFPVDLGLIGLSWEAGIPAVVVLYFFCLILLLSPQKNDYNYIRGWGLFLILTSYTLPFYYYHHNLIYMVIVFVIFLKLKHKEYYSKKVTCLKEL